MARQFTGGGYLSRADQTELRVAAPITIGIWWNSSTVGSFTYSISKVLLSGNHSSFAVGTNGSGDIRGMIGWGTGSSDFTVTPAVANQFDNAWHHIALTYDLSNMRFYIDGIQVSSIGENRAIAYSSSSLYVGCFEAGSITSPNTGAADLCIWNDALPASDLLQITKGFRSSMVRSDRIVELWPLDGRELTERGKRKGMDLTITGNPPYAIDPRLIGPGRSAIPRRPTSPPPLVSGNKFFSFFG